MSSPTQTHRLVSINLPGGFTLLVGREEVTSLPRKARALFAYLALQDGGSVTRDAMSDLLWTDRGAEEARHSLRQTLLVSRRDLREAGGHLIHSDRGLLLLRPGAVETDVARSRALAASSDRATLTKAGALYAGPLLAKFPPVAADFDDWLQRTRNELNELSLDVLGRLANCCADEGDADAVVRTAERMLALDPLREDVHRRLIAVHARVGRQVDAIRQYNSCVEILRRELDVGPSAETQALIAEIRQDRTGESMPPQHFEPATALFPRPSSGPPWVAVLPFRAISGDTVPEYFGVGLAEDIVALLAALREPVVISSYSSQTFREERPDLNRIGNSLGVSYVLSGSVRHANQSMRIHVELAETATSAVLWAHSYDVSGASIFDAQDSIATRIVYTIIPHIHDPEIRRIRSKRPESMTAYDLVLQARDHIMRLDRASFDRAGVLLQQARALDPDHALVHAGLANWHSLRVGQGWTPDPATDAHAVDAAARAALALDRTNARALAFYGHARSFLYRDYDQALVLFERALDSAPNDSIAWKWSCATFAYIGDGEEAARRAERALALSPHDLFIYGITTVRSISEQIQLVIVRDICGTVGCLKDHRFYRGFFKYCHRKHLHQYVE